MQRRVFIGCCPASQLGRLRQTVALLYVTVYPVSLSHCLFYEHHLSRLLRYPICLHFQSSRVSLLYCTHLLASHQPTLQLSFQEGHTMAGLLLHFIFRMTFVSPSFLRCPCRLAAPQWLMVYSTAEFLFSLSSPSVNRCHFGSSGEQSSFAANL